MRKNSLKLQMIGKRITVADSRHPLDVGKSGTVVDETRHTLIISTTKGNKRMMKENLIIKDEDTGKLIDGKKLSGRIEERLNQR